MDRRRPRSDWPLVRDWQHDVLEQYGDLLNNTGGNDPRDLLEDFLVDERMASANVVRFTLAVAVGSQVQLLAALMEAGLIPRERSK